ncbi:MAG TPA: hypothetical protein VKV29_00710 [Chthonomonas sp.]|uniref:hypothetical protein n=1 Tax=Chthonomonas sp. TaxID=2282153 RepID=UPI002B4AAE5A|nr:hypothetical protein [Chthonomonas sp.]HLH78784.1 hypothetical protein [Chthonomonas sp.]
MSGSKRLLSRFGIAGFYVLLGVLIGAFGVTMRSASSQPQEGSVTMPNLRTQSLTIVDSQGRPVITMGSIKQGEESTPVLQLSSWEGNKVLVNGFLVGQSSVLNQLVKKAGDMGKYPLIPFTPCVVLAYSRVGKLPSILQIGFAADGKSGEVVPVIGGEDSKYENWYIRLEGKHLLSGAVPSHLSKTESEQLGALWQSLMDKFAQKENGAEDAPADPK